MTGMKLQKYNHISEMKHWLVTYY